MAVSAHGDTPGRFTVRYTATVGKVGVRDARDHGTGPVLGFTAHK